jgi:hypothetical protein
MFYDIPNGHARRAAANIAVITDGLLTTPHKISCEGRCTTAGDAGRSLVPQVLLGERLRWLLPQFVCFWP